MRCSICWVGPRGYAGRPNRPALAPIDFSIALRSTRPSRSNCRDPAADGTYLCHPRHNRYLAGRP